MEQNRLAHLLVQVHGSSRRLPQLVGDLLTLQQTDRLWTCNNKLFNSTDSCENITGSHLSEGGGVTCLRGAEHFWQRWGGGGGQVRGGRVTSCRRVWYWGPKDTSTGQKLNVSGQKELEKSSDISRRDTLWHHPSSHLRQSGWCHRRWAWLWGWWRRRGFVWRWGFGLDLSASPQHCWRSTAQLHPSASPLWAWPTTPVGSLQVRHAETSGKNIRHWRKKRRRESAWNRVRGEADV